MERLSLVDFPTVLPATAGRMFAAVDCILRFTFACIASLAIAVIFPRQECPADSSLPLAWGNATYVNLTVGETRPCLGKTVMLLGVTNNVATVSVEGETRKLTVARLALPEACLLLESASQPGRYCIYQHLKRDKLLVRTGQTVERGERLAYIWGDGRCGHLHFSVVGDGGRPDYAGRYRYLLNCFPQLVELWHGSLSIETPNYTSGNFRFANQYWEDGNTQRLSAWSDVLGYGWLLGGWCPAGKVEHSLVDEGGKPFQSVRLSKIMHTQTRQPARNPQDWFDFEVAVENGVYRVRAEVGDHYAATWQRVEFEGIDVGTLELPRQVLAWTEEEKVAVRDGRLTIRIRLRDERTPAGLRNLVLERIP